MKKNSLSDFEQALAGSFKISGAPTLNMSPGGKIF